MELIKKQFMFDCQKNKEVTFVSKEETFNLSETMEDIAYILQQRAEINILEIKKEENGVHVLGEINFSFLYMSASLDKHPAGFSGRMSFDEKINIDGMEIDDDISLDTNLENIKVDVLNSRKVRVNAVVELTVSAENKCGEEVVTDISTTDSAIQTKKNSLKFLNKVNHANETVRIEESLQLPSGHDNIGRIIWFSVWPANVDFKQQEGKVAIFGDLQVFVIYQAESDEKIQYIQEMVPFHQMISCDGCDDGVIINCRFSVDSSDVEAEADMDGEDRSLHISCMLNLDLCLFREEEAEYLEDVYSVRDNVIPETTMLTWQKLLSQNNSKCRINEVITLKNNAAPVLQLIYSSGKLKNIRQLQEEGGILVEGIVAIDGLYISSDDDKPFDKFNGELEFKHFVEIPHMDIQSEYKMDCRLEQVSVNMAGEGDIEVKALVSLQILAYDIALCPVILDIKKETMDTENVKNIPGITGYVANEEELLWDIAKKYMTTVDYLKEINNITADVVHPKDTLIIVKSVGEVLSDV